MVAIEYTYSWEKKKILYELNSVQTFTWESYKMFCVRLKHSAVTLCFQEILSLRVSAQSLLYSECVMSLQVGQPASRTCLQYGSCPGQRRRADGSGGDPYPVG